ncbi:unnamed protein product [Ectocarpus sp. 12 AP-2014]
MVGKNSFFAGTKPPCDVYNRNLATICQQPEMRRAWCFADFPGGSYLLTGRWSQARDDCVIMNGEEECKNFIEAHKECLRSEGFDIR